MLIHRDTLKAALLAVDTAPSRYFLHAVQVQPDGRVVATNGHVLLIAKATHQFADADFPHAQQLTFDHSPTTPVCIPTVICEKLIAGTPKKLTIPVLGYVQVGVTAAPAETFAAATDLETSVVKVLDTGDTAPRFPTFDKVLVSEDRPHLTLQLSADYLVLLAKAAKLVYGKHQYGGVVELQIPTEPEHNERGTIVSQVRVVIRGGGGETEVEGVIMPVRA